MLRTIIQDYLIKTIDDANKIFTLLLVGALTAGAVTANAESQIFKKKKKNVSSKAVKKDDGNKNNDNA